MESNLGVVKNTWVLSITTFIDSEMWDGIKFFVFQFFFRRCRSTSLFLSLRGVSWLFEVWMWEERADTPQERWRKWFPRRKRRRKSTDMVIRWCTSASNASGCSNTSLTLASISARKRVKMFKYKPSFHKHVCTKHNETHKCKKWKRVFKYKVSFVRVGVKIQA